MISTSVKKLNSKNRKGWFVNTLYIFARIQLKYSYVRDLEFSVRNLKVCKIERGTAVIMPFTI